ncbi:hypothetical protein GCM10027615_21610 [Plantactinospora veratri]
MASNIVAVHTARYPGRLFRSATHWPKQSSWSMTASASQAVISRLIAAVQALSPRPLWHPLAPQTLYEIVRIGPAVAGVTTSARAAVAGASAAKAAVRPRPAHHGDRG